MRQALVYLLISAIAVIGSTAPLAAANEQPSAGREQSSTPAKIEKPPAKQTAPAIYKISGRCIDQDDRSPVAGVRVPTASQTGPPTSGATSHASTKSSSPNGPTKTACVTHRASDGGETYVLKTSRPCRLRLLPQQEDDDVPSPSLSAAA